MREGGVGTAAGWSARRAEVARWDLPLVAGVLPFLAGGFVASAAANRIAFAAWGLAAALAWFGALRLGLVRGWSRGRRAAALAAVAAAALAALAPLVARHGGALDSGLRVLAPAPASAHREAAR